MTRGIWVKAPPPQTSQRTLTIGGLTVEDQEVDWGALRLGQGQAFFFGQSGSGNSLATAKHWQVTPNNRKFLVEEVPFTQLLREILSRSGGASLDKPESKIRALASLDRLPKLKPARPNTRPMKLAAALPPERGVVIDYVTMPATITNYVFQADTTYYISDSVRLAGTNTWEGGAVLKFGLGRPQ